MADQITKSVRRIVKDMKDDPNGLGATDELKGIGTSRGEGYINARGDVTSSSNDGSEDKDEQPGTSTPPTDDPADNDTGGGGGVNKGETDPDNLNGDAEYIDENASEGDTIGTVTGTSVDGQTIYSLVPTPIEGIEYIPPDTWNSPESPGTATEHTGVEITPANACSILGCPTNDVAESRGNTVWDSNTGYTYTVGYFTHLPGAIDIYPSGFSAPAFATCISCGSNTDGYFPFVAKSDVTTAEPPPIDLGDWPSDSVCQITYDHSEIGYKGNERDTDCSAAEKTASECVIIRSATDPSKYFRYCRLVNGGTKITTVDSSGTPTPGSVTKTTDADGRVNGFYDVSLDASIK